MVFTKQLKQVQDVLENSGKTNLARNLDRIFLSIDAEFQIIKNDNFMIPVWAMVKNKEQAEVVKKLSSFITTKFKSSRDFEFIRAFPEEFRQMIFEENILYTAPIFKHVYMNIKDPVDRYLAFRDVSKRYGKSTISEVKNEKKSYVLTLKKHNSKLPKKLENICNKALNDYHESLKPEPFVPEPVFASIPLSDGTTYDMPIEELHEIISVSYRNNMEASINDEEVAEMMDIEDPLNGQEVVIEPNDDPSGLSGAKDETQS